MIPLVLHPYNPDPTVHRAYEYFSILHGGMNPHHLMSPDFTVRYREKPPAPDMYLPHRVTPEMLDLYDVVLVIGKPGRGGLDLVRFLRSRGFREVTSDKFTGVFVRGS